MVDTNLTLLSRGNQGADEFDFTFTTNSFGLESAYHPTLKSVPGITFSRSTTGYAKNNIGQIINFGANVPRVTNLGLLMEPARANYLLRSNDITNASSWAVSNATVGNNGSAAPDGSFTAQYLMETTATSVHNLYQTFTTVASTAYTVSVWLQAALRPRAVLHENGSGADAVFDLVNGAVVTIANCSAHIDTVSPSFNSGTSSQMYRCVFTFVTGAAQTSATFSITSALVNNTVTYAGSTATAAFLVWGAQAEAGYAATSLIVTTTAVVGRSGDVLLLGQNSPAVGTAFMEFVAPGINGLTQELFYAAPASPLYLNGGAAYTYDGATNIGLGSVPTYGNLYRAAVTWDTSSRAASLNGAAVVADANFIPVGAMSLGCAGGDASQLVGYLRRFRLMNWRLSNQDVRALASF